MNAAWFEQQARLMKYIVETQMRILNAVGNTAAGRQWYSPAEFAEAVNRRPSTIRLWCRRGRIEARKRPLGRGDKLEWEISSDELERYQNHGLLNSNQKF